MSVMAAGMHAADMRRLKRKLGHLMRSQSVDIRAERNRFRRLFGVKYGFYASIGNFFNAVGCKL
ncbi:hypothetical protein SDC9_174294 [bioreactor metagenome]|uniref:Uncharacterized protein n=1 Tax=bioreactor metagenome TaxID=1076179 RepID=A0A645GIV9_9ZZZZ